MKFITPASSEAVRLRLKLDRTRMLKQGYPWIYKDWLEEVPDAKAGSRALVRDLDGSLIAFGMFDPQSPLAVRVCALEYERLDDDLVLKKLDAALELRRRLYRDDTTGYRLINGEGDGLPGLVCDRYQDHAVIKLDGDAPSEFWNTTGIAEWLSSRIGIEKTFHKLRSDAKSRGSVVRGTIDDSIVSFVENGITFEADIVAGQKTGFFFDQRDNRDRIRKLSRGQEVLNLFAYTGGFSVYAGVGGARHVTTVDLAKPAIESARKNWELNRLNPAQHDAVAADAFEFLAEAKASKREWDLIVVDPPSFAPGEKHVLKAKEAYQSLFIASLDVLKRSGIIAFASCSSHIPQEMFLELCQGALSKTRKRGTVLGVYGQPEDHPFPFACRELQYLKFVIMRVV